MTLGGGPSLNKAIAGQYRLERKKVRAYFFFLGGKYINVITIKWTEVGGGGGAGRRGGCQIEIAIPEIINYREVANGTSLALSLDLTTLQIRFPIVTSI